METDGHYVFVQRRHKIRHSVRHVFTGAAWSEHTLPHLLFTLNCLDMKYKLEQIIHHDSRAGDGTS
jgi:lipopolysaccharide biosynthesis protein